MLRRLPSAAVGPYRIWVVYHGVWVVWYGMTSSRERQEETLERLAKIETVLGRLDGHVKGVEERLRRVEDWRVWVLGASAGVAAVVSAIFSGRQ